MSAISNLCRTAAMCAAVLPACAAQAAAAAQPPDLDLSIQHYSRVMTAEGVLRETRYEETMVRRPGHVWLARVLPAQRVHAQGHPGAAGKPEQHTHPNYAVLARHVMLDRGKIRLEAVNAGEREVIAIPPGEYDNVNFDNSWPNAFFLIDPRRVAALPLSKRPSAVTGARWREQERNGQFQRVLWDDARMVPLVVETGDRAGTFFERVTVKPLPAQAGPLPWTRLKDYAQREYADFLD
ncbi:MAG TPA: hypothetical protein VGF26_13900 [Ramlibacter sp.]